MDHKETLNSGKQDGKGNAKLSSNEFKAARSSDESDNESTGESSSGGSQDEDNENYKWDFNDTIRESFVPAISVVMNRCTKCGDNMHQQQKFCDKCGSTSEAVNVGGMIKKSESEFVSHEIKFCTDFKGANIGSKTGGNKSKSASIAPKVSADCETANIGNAPGTRKTF